eukprot:6479916-Amphidinium_carterae.1
MRVDADTIRRCALDCGQNPDTYVEKVKHGRWGTSLDFKLLASELDLPCILLNRETGSILHEHRSTSGSKKQALIVYARHHFTVGSQPKWFHEREGGECMQHLTSPEVQGGGPKRPYPFAPGPVTGGPAVVAGGPAVVHPPVILTYHGSFAPMHTGHRECIARALVFLKAQGVVVQQAVLGFTSETHVAKKSVDCDFAPVKTRIDIAREVLKDGEPMEQEVVVDNEALGSSMALAAKYAQQGCNDLYLLGSDLMKRPPAQTLIVTRTMQERVRCGPEYFDTQENKGVCWQSRSLGVTSTKVRNALAELRMPRLYSVKSQRMIMAAIAWNAKKKLKAEASTNTSTTTASASQAVAAAGTVSAVPSHPVKGEEVERPPLLRKRQSSQLTLTPRVEEQDRPPLQRRRPTHQTTAEQTPEQGRPMVDDISLPIAPEAYRLTISGTMKMQPPFYSNLGKFWHDTVVPMCHLLEVVPVSLCRRGLDGQLRISFFPGSESKVPLVRFVVPSDLVELYRNLKQIGTVHLYCSLLAFNLTHIGMADIDPDTVRGIVVRDVLSAAVVHASKMTLLSTIRVGFFILESAQLVVLGCPTYKVSALVLAEEVQEIIDGFLTSFEVETGECVNIRLLINTEKTVHVTGGMRARPGNCTPPCSSPEDPHAHAFGIAGTIPRQDVDPLEHPFQIFGEDEQARGVWHALQNLHDMATMTDRHYRSYGRRSNWHCQPLLDDNTEGQSSRTSLEGSEDGRAADSSDDDDFATSDDESVSGTASGDTTPRSG